MLIQPETLLRWHRHGFRLVWTATSAAASATPRIAEETRRVIRTMAVENRLWGAERIRGELLKLGIRVSTRTVQKYMRRVHQPQHPSQTWATVLQNHAHDIWACDFLQGTDLWFRSLCAVVMIELGSRSVIHIGVTRHPTDEWVAQQLREATPFGVAPRSLIRDNDSRYGSQLARVAATSSIEVLRTPIGAPRANAICEHFLGSVRRECVDHVLIVRERHRQCILHEYVAYWNRAHPHQGIDQAIPGRSGMDTARSQSSQRLVSLPIVGGLHHDDRCAA